MKSGTGGIAEFLFFFSGDNPGKGVVVMLLYTYTHVKYSKEVFGEQGNEKKFSRREISIFLIYSLQNICDLFKADESSLSTF